MPFYSPLSHFIPRIPAPIPRIPNIPTLSPWILALISRIPTLILRVPILTPQIPIIPLIPFPDSPFRLLQIVFYFCILGQ